MKIQVRNVYKVFGKNPERGVSLFKEGVSKDEILKKHRLTVGVADASFDVEQGEVFVIMGLSGSGKSTLIRCLNRLHEPTSGQILVDGDDVVAMDHQELREMRRAKMGMVFQRFALLPSRTILDNVAFGLEIQGIDRDKRRETAAETIKAVGLDGWENHYPSELSGGMQQRVGLARALASDPDILLMDEPFSALDPLIRKEMQDELLRLQSKMNKTIVFITHDLDEALSLGDRIAIMKDAQIIQQGTSEDILNHPEDDYVARFTEGVDRSKILTAENVMKKPITTAALDRDGVNTILRKMERHGVSSVLVVDRDNVLQGAVQADDLARAKREDLSVRDVMTAEVPTTPPDRSIRELLETASDTPFPISVVDEDRRLMGIIVRGHVLAALSRRGEL